MIVIRASSSVLAALAATLMLLACSPQGERPPFVDITGEVGLSFEHDNGMTGKRYFSEVVGPGAALFDYDNDGDLDAFIVQGGSLDPATDPETLPSDMLWRNDSVPGQEPLMHFVDVTSASGIHGTGYGMGVATGDVNGDGLIDLYVTNFGPNKLWLNGGDGTFIDATTPTLEEPRWSTSATFFDYDLDGDLDLFGANYVGYRIAQHRPCLNAAGAIEYCGPASFPPETDRLWRNLGDGTFEDVTGIAGLIDLPASALGVVSADFNDDGWPDLYVTNDLMPNHLWLNQGDGTFVEDALLAGCAVNENGAPEASMGLAVADFDRDGDEDLFMTHLDTETNTAYSNLGNGLFEDASNEWGLTIPSLGLTGFGTAALDFDNDGWLDLIAANGAVKTIAEQRIAGDPLPLREPNLLLQNREGRFHDLTSTVPALLVADVGRGLATGDIDNDGDDDVLVLNNNGPAQLLRNEVGQAGSWIGVILTETTTLGARIAWVGEARHQLRTSRSGQSYCSASDPRVRLGGTTAQDGYLLVAPLRGAPRRLMSVPRRHYLRLPLIETSRP
jgi:hypothetical protein